MKSRLILFIVLLSAISAVRFFGSYRPVPRYWPPPTYPHDYIATIIDQDELLFPPWDVHLDHDTWQLIPALSSDMPGYMAETFCNTHMIFYVPDVTWRLHATIVHELLHAGTCSKGEVHNKYWNSYSEAKHEGFYLLSFHWAGLMYTNPQLAEWLTK